MKKLAGCLVSQCPGVIDPEDGSGELIVTGASPDGSEASVRISRDLLQQADELQVAYDKLLKAAGAFVRLHNEFPDDPGAYGESFDYLWTVIGYCEAERDGFTGVRKDLAEVIAK